MIWRVGVWCMVYGVWCIDRAAGDMGYLNDLGASFRNNGADVFSSSR